MYDSQPAGATGTANDSAAAGCCGKDVTGGGGGITNSSPVDTNLRMMQMLYA